MLLYFMGSDTSRVIENPPKAICEMNGVFCCNGFKFAIEPNVTIFKNETLQVFKDNRLIGNITNLGYGCNEQGSIFRKF